MSEIVLRVPVNSEFESGERDLIDMDGSLESNGLDSLVWNTMWEVGKVLSVDTDMVVSIMNVNLEMELIVMLKWVVVTNFWSPSSVGGGVHGNNMVMLETEVHVENDVWSGEKLNGEVFVMVVSDMSADVDLRSSTELFTDSVSAWNVLKEFYFEKKNHGKTLTGLLITCMVKLVAGRVCRTAFFLPLRLPFMRFALFEHSTLH